MAQSPFSADGADSIRRENMTEAELMLVDLREQVKEALEQIDCDVAFSVRQSYPRERAEGVIITYNEFNNRSTDCSVVDELSYQIDIWAFDRETVVKLTEKVNRAMLELGLRRVYMGPDKSEDSKYERKTMRFGRKIDKRFMRLVD
jgi:hypothetical protein